MRLLFLLRHTGYLRHYETAVAAAARRGHVVAVGFNLSTKSGADYGGKAVGLLALNYPNVNVAVLPFERGWRSAILMRTRNLRNYLRYLEPEYVQSAKLADRALLRVPSFLQVALSKGLRLLSAHSQRRLSLGLGSMDLVLRRSPLTTTMLKQYRPDALAVSPMVDLDSKQLDYLKAGKSQFIPNAVCIASWDNLTNKGVIQLQPTRTLVWNRHQMRELEVFHGIDREQVRCSGAQTFDEWFIRKPFRTRLTFCTQLGLDPTMPLVLYVCSSTFIAERECDFVRKWIDALRTSPSASLREASVIIRPHPLNARIWSNWQSKPVNKAVVWPKHGEYVTTESARRNYFDTLFHANAVVGINTSAFIEAGILGKPCHTICVPEFAATQEGTLHFAHLLRHGFLVAGRNLSEHVAQLTQSLEHPEGPRTAAIEFVKDFVRPHGLEVTATSKLIEYLEELPLLDDSLGGVRFWKGRAPIQLKVNTDTSAPSQTGTVLCQQRNPPLHFAASGPLPRSIDEVPSQDRHAA